MMLDPDIAIVNIAEDARYDTVTFERHPFIRVDFKVGKFGPFTERFNKDGYTLDTRDQTLNAFARHVRS